MIYSAKEISGLFGVSEEVAAEAMNNLASGAVELISFSGKIGSGKDTIAPLLFGDRWDSGFVSHQFFARGVKSEVQEIFEICRSSENPKEAVERVVEHHGVSYEDAYKMCGYLYDEVRDNLELTAYEKTENVRSSLQYWGTDVRRKKDDDYWVKLTMRSVLTELANGKSVSMTDSRFPNEMDAVIDCGGIAVRLDVSPEVQAERIMSRDGVVVTDDARAHPSETSLDNYPYFHAIVDTDNKPVYDVVEDVLEQIRGV